MKSHYAQKRDANEADIVDALLATGHEVYRLTQFPADLLVGRRFWCVMECKGPSGRLTPAQERFFDSSGTAPRVIVRNAQEAVEAARRFC